MFEESLVESTGLLRPRNHRSVLLSVVIQAAIATALLSIPLVHPEILPLHLPPMSLVAPVPKPVPPTVPRERVPSENTNATALSVPSAPTPLGPRISHTELTGLSSDAPPADGSINIGGTSGSGLPLALGTGPVSTGTRVVAAAPASSARARISQGVSAGLLLAPIRPVYPIIAKAAHIEGVVVVQAVISKAGAVESARAVSGPVMLQAAALEAVTKARYKPYLLSGEPTEVDTTFTVAFHLSGS